MDRALLLLKLTFLGVLLESLAITSSWASSSSSGDKLIDTSKLEMFVDELPEMPRIHGYKFVHGVPKSRSLKIGMFRKRWVRFALLNYLMTKLLICPLKTTTFHFGPKIVTCLFDLFYFHKFQFFCCFTLKEMIKTILFFQISLCFLQKDRHERSLLWLFCLDPYYLEYRQNIKYGHRN